MNALDFELRELRQLLAIASEGSFAKAARSLHISQPALSHSIKEVERKTGFRLFERGREGATPTDTGRMLLRHAETVMATATDLQRELTLIRGVGTGALRVGTGLFPASLFLGETMGRLLERGADIQLRIVGGAAPELLMLLRKREVDVVFADPAWLDKTTDVTAVELSKHDAYLFARAKHPLCAQSKIAAKDVIAYPLVTSSTVPPRMARMPTRSATKQASMQTLLARWNPSITADSVPMMKEVVKASDAVTILSLYLARQELARGELAILPIPLSWIKARFAVMYLSHRTLSPLAEALINAARLAAAEVQKQEQQLAKRWIKPG
jgi:DNA-binding transcriptional LysR family regulator